jgi:uncharacterized RDD family membrane protein YckC
VSDRIGFRLRAAALAVDVTSVLLLSFLFGPWLGIRLGLGVYQGQGPGAGGMMAGAVAGTALIGLLWFGTEALWAATPGKRLLGLRIGTADGQPAPRSRLVLRWALKNVATLLALLAVLLGIALPAPAGAVAWLSNLGGLVMVGGCFAALGPRRQALHDLLARTAVYPAAALAAPQD